MIMTALIDGLVVFLGIMLAFALGYLLTKRKITSATDTLLETIHAFIDSPGDNQPSPLALIVDSLAQQSGHTIAIQLKTTLMGQASGLAKQEAALMADITEDQIAAGNPLIAGLVNQMGSKTKSRLMKNPQLLEAVMSMVSKGGSGSSQSGNNGGGSRPKFKL